MIGFDRGQGVLLRDNGEWSLVDVVDDVGAGMFEQEQQVIRQDGAYGTNLSGL